MSKYIDMVLLRKEIEKNKNIIDGLFTEGDNSYYEGQDDGYNHILNIIASLQEEQPPRGYDEAYLNECIAKASKTWEGVDADKYLDEVRGRELEQPDIKSYIEELLKECAGKDGEYYRSRRETLAHLFAYLGGNPLEYILQPVKQPEIDLGKDNPNSRPVAMIDRDGNTIEVFDSSLIVNQLYGIARESVCRCCNGKQKSAGGYKWKYIEKEIKL